MAPSELPLRDVHLPPPPGWWPPAPGWWWLGAGLLLLVAIAVAISWRRRARLRRWERLFVEESRGDTAVARIAAISALLRRAARRIDRNADTLTGEAWLRWLDGPKAQAFSAGPGRALLDHGFRPRGGEAELAALEPLARKRFVQLMAGRR